MANQKLKRNEQSWFRDEENRGSRSSMPMHRNNNNVASNVAVPVLFGPLSNFFGDMERVFEQSFRNLGFPSPASFGNLLGMQPMFRPNVDITSNDKEYIITAEVPGLNERDVRLDVSADGTLRISGEKRQENIESRKDVQCMECSYGAFERSLSLPEDADPEGIEARFRNGVLTIVCPRIEMSRMQTRQIPISSGQQGGGRAMEGRAANTSEPASGGQGPRKAA